MEENGSLTGFDLEKNLAEMIEKLARESGDATAILAPDANPLDYGALYRQVADTKARLREFGIGRRDVVAVALPNGPEMATAFLSIASAAACAPLNPSLNQSSHETYLNDLGATTVAINDQMPEVESAARRLGIPILRIVADSRQGAGAFTLQTESKPSATRISDDESARPDDVALILPTSGTTSKPKLVPLSHGNLCISSRNIISTLELGPADRCLNMMPLFHIHGLVACLLSTIASGGSIVCTPGFSAKHFHAWLEEYSPTWYSAVPTIHQSVLGCGRPDRVRLRFIRSSSASLPPKVMSDLEEMFEAPVIEAYGMTEAAHQMASNRLSRQKPGKVGPPAGPEIMIVDNDWKELPDGTTGEIVIRGGNVTCGYIRNESANRDSFRDGWFRTGDQGYFDEDGFLCLTGRTKELINRGGEKIAPREIEEALLEHPAVAQAVSFSIPHPTLGEEIAAAVVLRSGMSAGEDELTRHTARRLAQFKVPRLIRFLPEIPKGPTGKIQRIGMAERLGISGLRAAGEDYVAPDQPLEEQIARIWQDVLKHDLIGAGDNFFLIGGDSLLAVEVLTRISAELVDIDHVALYENPVLRDFARVVQAELDNPARVEGISGGVIPIRIGASRRPLFCLAGHNNKFGIFCRIASHLDAGQPVFGLPYPALTPQRDHYTVGELADELIARMRDLQPSGPYRIFGHCFGGFVAFEMARRLTALGEQTELLFMMDSYLPAQLRHGSFKAGDNGKRIDFHLHQLGARDWNGKMAYLTRRIQIITEDLTAAAGNALFNAFLNLKSQRPSFLITRNIASRYAFSHFEPGEYAGTVRLIRMQDHRSEAGLMGWEGWIKANTELIRAPYSDQGVGSEECVAVYAPQVRKLLES